MADPLSLPVPLHPPEYLLRAAASADWRDARRGEHAHANLRGLLQDYAGASGYVRRWGHLVEHGRSGARFGAGATLSFVPVALWITTGPARDDVGLSIHAWSQLVRREVVSGLDRLPHGVMLADRKLAYRSSSLFSVSLRDADRLHGLRTWIFSVFEPVVWPRLVRAMVRRVEIIAAHYRTMSDSDSRWKPGRGPQPAALGSNRARSVS